MVECSKRNIQNLSGLQANNLIHKKWFSSRGKALKKENRLTLESWFYSISNPTQGSADDW